MNLIYLFAFQVVVLSATTGLSQAQRVQGFAVEYALITENSSNSSHCEPALVNSSLGPVQLQYRTRNQGEEEGNGNSATNPGWRNLSLSTSELNIIPGWQLIRAVL